jgi:CHAD domain-containing protein
MAFEFKKGERVPKGVRRIVCKRIDRAMELVRPKNRRNNGAKNRAAVSDHAVHEVRKRFKEIRGTLRLVRDELGEEDFRRENRTFRDAGRPLSEVRDAKVLVDSLDGLIEHFNGRVKPQSASRLRRALVARRRATRQQVLERGRAVADIARSIRAAKKRVKSWALERNGWKALQGGLRKVYRQARRAMQSATSDPSDANLHEWRKRTKDLRYELELLCAVWPEMIGPMVEQAHHLTDLLGDDHDLSVLRVIAAQECAENGSPDENELLFALIDERRQSLQKEANELGRKLYEERPADFVARLHGYWKTSRRAAA